MLFIYDFINQRESPIKVFEFVPTVVELINTELEMCGYTETLLKMQKFCSEDEKCTKRLVTKNFYLRGFNMIGAYRRVTETLAYFDTSSDHEVYLQCVKLGWELGKVLRILFEFKI